MSVISKSGIKNQGTQDITNSYRDLIPHPPVVKGNVRASKYSYGKNKHIDHGMLKPQGEEGSEGKPHQHHLSWNAAGSFGKDGR